MGHTIVQTVIADFQIMPAERSFSEHLERFVSAGRATSAPALPGTVHVAVHNDPESLRSVWQDLEKKDSNSLHQSYGWCQSWLAATGAESIIVVVSVSANPVIILPLETRHTPLGVVAEFIGTEHSNINTGLLDPAFAQNATREAMNEVAAAIRSALKGRVSLLSLSNMPDVWQGVPNPFRFFFKVENQNHTYQLPLIGTFEETLAQINAKRRRKKYRKSVKLLDELGGFEHVVAESKDEKTALLETFFAQKRIRFQAAGIPDVFAEEKVQSFFSDIADQADDEKNYLLKLHAIKMKNGHIPAVASLSRKGNHVICQFSSIDESFVPEASPGELLFYLMVEQLHAEGAEIFDFGLGYMRYKSSWCPVETVQHDIHIPVALAGWLPATFAAARTRMKALIKQNKLLYRFLQSRRAESASA